MKVKIGNKSFEVSKDVTDITDDDELIKKQLFRAEDEFLDLFPDSLIKSMPEIEVFSLLRTIIFLIPLPLRLRSIKDLCRFPLNTFIQ